MEILEISLGEPYLKSALKQRLKQGFDSVKMPLKW